MINLKNILLHLMFHITLFSFSFSPSYCLLPRCICRESGWRRWRRPLHRSTRHRWWNFTGERRGSGRPQSGPGDSAHDPGKHRFSSDHASPTHSALSGKIVGMAHSHRWIIIHCCKHCWWTITCGRYQIVSVYISAVSYQNVCIGKQG